MEPESSLPHSQVPATCPYPVSFACCVILPPETLPPRRSEWGSSLPPDCFVSRGSISPCECFLTSLFDREAWLAPRPIPKLEDHPLSAVRDCLFNIFAATLHIGGRSSICNPRTRHAVVTGTHLHGKTPHLITINSYGLRNTLHTSQAWQYSCPLQPLAVIKY
jgi:hypothetical protein